MEITFKRGLRNAFQFSLRFHSAITPDLPSSLPPLTLLHFRSFGGPQVTRYLTVRLNSSRTWWRVRFVHNAYLPCVLFGLIYWNREQSLAITRARKRVHASRIPSAASLSPVSKDENGGRKQKQGKRIIIDRACSTRSGLTAR